MKLSTLLSSTLGLAVVSAWNLNVHDQPDGTGAIRQYFSCDADEGCYPVNPPFGGNVVSLYWSPHGSSYTMYDGASCAGRIVQQGGPSDSGILNLPNRNVQSFRITGGLIGCDIENGK